MENRRTRADSGQVPPTVESEGGRAPPSRMPSALARQATGLMPVHQQVPGGLQASSVPQLPIQLNVRGRG